MPEVNALADTFAVMGAAMQFEHNAEIFGEGEPAEYFYQVVKGAVRTYKLLNDGRRQISAFHLPGDVFGLEAGEEHRFTAEAIADSTVLVIKRTHSDGAGQPRQRGRQRPVDAGDRRPAPGAGPHAAARPQERP